MATGPSVNITSAPTLVFVSVTTAVVTLNLTAIPTNANAVTIAYRKVGESSWTMATKRTATGQFTIASLTDGAVYDFLAIPQETAGEIGPASAPLRVAMNTGSTGFGLSELLEAVKETAQNVVWPGSATKLFNTNGVRIVSDEGVAEDELAKCQFPVAFIYEMGSSGGVVDETPTFAVVQVGITIITIAHGDPFGTKVLMGGNRVSSQVNAGAGIYDLHDVVQQQLTKLLRNGTYPVRFLGVTPSAASARPMQDGRKLAMKTYTMSALIKELS